MIAPGEHVTLDAGTPVHSATKLSGLVQDKRLTEDHTFKIVDVGWETLKLHSTDAGTLQVLRSHVLRAFGFLQPQPYINRRPAPGDLVEHVPSGRIVLALDIDGGQLLHQNPNETRRSRLPADQFVVIPANPYSYPKRGFPAFESIVGLSAQGFLRRPKTMLADTDKTVNFVLKKVRDIVSANEFPVLSLDTETTGLTNRAYMDGPDFALGLCLSWDANSGFYLPSGPAFRDRHIELLETLRDAATTVMHNATFDIIAVKESYAVDLRAGLFHDTQVLSKLVDENRMNHKLKPLATELLGRSDVIHYDSVSGDDNTLVGVDPQVVAEYAAADSANTHGLFELLYPQVEADPDLLAYYENVELPAIARIAVPIADHGLKVDLDKLRDLHGRVQADRDDLMATLQRSVQSFKDAKLAALHKEIQALQRDTLARVEAFYGLDADPEDLEQAHRLIKAVKNVNSAGILARKKAFKSIDSFIKAAEKEAAKPADEIDFNPGSPLQLRELIHDHWGLPVVKLTKTGDERKTEHKGPWTKDHDRLYSSVGTKSIPALQLALKAQKTSNPDAELFFETFVKYSKTTKLISAFTEPTLELLGQMEARGMPLMIHPGFNSLGTKSSRSSCQNPNLQQLPSDDKLYDFRDCFIPDDEEHVFIDADYNAQEIRVMAAFSRDPDLIRIIEEDRDLHCHTVRTVWPEVTALEDDDIKDNHKTKRQKAKVTFFLTGYGGGKFKLAESLLIPVDEAAHIINTLKYKAFPRLTAWKEEQTELLRAQKELVLPCGYKRRLKGWENAKDPQRAKSAMERSIVNTVIQGTSAEMMKSAWFRVENALRDAGIPHQIKILIHDQMVFQVHRDHAVEAAKLCEKHMYSELFGIPVPAEVEIKTSLSKSKDANDKHLEAAYHGEEMTYDEVAEILEFESEAYVE